VKNANKGYYAVQGHSIESLYLCMQLPIND